MIVSNKTIKILSPNRHENQYKKKEVQNSYRVQEEEEEEPDVMEDIEMSIVSEEIIASEHDDMSSIINRIQHL